MTVICFCCAWGLVGFLSWQIGTTLCQGIPHVQRLHRIPCDRCQYCTGNPVLKCTVRPYTALSEQAIDCPDFVTLQ
jgi:hypothetical protein